LILKGDAATALVDQSGDVDTLVLGSRGYGALRSALTGAVSGKVTRAASCPILIVPRGSEDHGT
ncbi:MAG: universal stress protein, partial [Solirubrobacterales bacterium]